MEKDPFSWQAGFKTEPLPAGVAFCRPGAFCKISGAPCLARICVSQSRFWAEHATERAPEAGVGVPWVRWDCVCGALRRCGPACDSGTSVGVLTWKEAVSAGSPSWPIPPQPQAKTLPVSVSTSVWRAPQLTCTAKHPFSNVQQ